MTIKSAVELAGLIEECALESSKTCSTIGQTVSSTFSTTEGTVSMQLTMYDFDKFFGLARYNNLVGRVRVDGGKAKILSIECERN